MTKVNLAGYTLSELKGLYHDIERAIKGHQQQEIDDARDQILAIAKQVGVSVEQLLGNVEKKTRVNNSQKVKPKYQNPKDGSQTWTGRGRQPRWVAEEMASGKTLEDLRMH